MTTVYIYLVIFVPGIFGVTLCGPGLYGEHCDKHCNVNCRAHVDKQRYCDKDTGDCSLGCVPERWGSQCELHCSKNCVERVCFQQTGQCSKGCTENYRGHLCEEYIVPGMFGVTPCGPGLYGEHCDKHCNVNCRAHFDKQRYCDKDTGDCSLGCVPERWGSQCNFLCSKNCVDRVCFQQTGQCSKGCTENYRGHLCEEYIETRPETLTTVPPRNDPPEETHSDKVLTAVAVDAVAVAVAVAVDAVAVACTAAFVVCRRKCRHRKSGTSTTELHGADVEETLRLKLIRAADSHDEKTKSLEQSKSERVHVDDNEVKDIYASQDTSSKASEIPLTHLDPQDAL